MKLFNASNMPTRLPFAFCYLFSSRRMCSDDIKMASTKNNVLVRMYSKVTGHYSQQYHTITLLFGTSATEHAIKVTHTWRWAYCDRLNPADLNKLTLYFEIQREIQTQRKLPTNKSSTLPI